MANRYQQQQNYYTNPAFCQKSEFYNSGNTVQIVTRQSPVGAQTPFRYVDNENSCDEQEFYEEMLVDDSGVVKEKKILVVSSQTDQLRQKSRYEYIPLQEQAPNRYVLVQNSPAKYRYVETTTNEELQPNHRYEYIEEDYSPRRNRYESPPKTAGARYQAPLSPRQVRYVQANPQATQKLHEILTTPKKRVMSPPSQRRPMSTPSRDPFITPQTSPQKSKSKAQQKLNYAIGTRQFDKRQNTAIVAPICSSPLQSVYSETTYSPKNESWMNLSFRKPPIQATLAVAAVMMVLCGSVTIALCFYMVSIMGRLYFLDFGTVAGFTCLVLGLLGFRTRNCYWLPNRNYISGYIVLSVFSLLTCAGLLVLLVLQPKPGTPLADMTSGAVCGISVLSLILATAGVVSSYCCKYPPPDNRVQHCVQGFTV